MGRNERHEILRAGGLKSPGRLRGWNTGPGHFGSSVAEHAPQANLVHDRYHSSANRRERVGTTQTDCFLPTICLVGNIPTETDS
jgi:hypothetical protein